MSPAARIRILFVFAALLWANPGARALDVYGYVAGTNERFSSGFPGSPVVNPSFFLNAYNLSGVGWTSGNFGVTLISPQHFLTAAHVAPAPASSVTFLNTDGVLKSYTVDSNYTVLHAAGVDTDLVVGRLSSPIPGSDHVAYYPTLYLNSAGDYVGLTVAAFGQGQRAGTNTVDAAGQVDMLPFGSPNGTLDNVIFTTDYDPVSGQTQGQGGDSGSPTFVNVNGNLALLGTHSAIDTTSSPNLTLDVLIPAYYSQINSRLALDGYGFGTFVAVPEPSTWAVLGGLAAVGWAVGARRRRRQVARRN